MIAAPDKARQHRKDREMSTPQETIEVAQITAFLYAGALQHPTLGTTGAGLCLDRWEGHTGFVTYCALYAGAINDWLHTRDDIMPGVLEYELIEPLGEWLLESCRACLETAEVLGRFKAQYLAWIEDKK
jgi:hypothetical protein